MSTRPRSPLPLLALGVAVAACRDATPPPPVALPPRELAFVSDRRLGQFDIYLMGTDGKLRVERGDPR